MKKEDQLKRET